MDLYIEKYSMHLYYDLFAQKELKPKKVSKGDSIWRNQG